MELERNNLRDLDRTTQRLFLRAGDRVFHMNFPRWGRGVVTEERASTLSGGFCMARVLFDDGLERSFINDLENPSCCYYAGIRIEED